MDRIPAGMCQLMLAKLIYFLSDALCTGWCPVGIWVLGLLLNRQEVSTFT